MSINNGYILGPLIARGGMAEIFLGKSVGQDEFERLFAIKRILPHYAQDKDFVAMFRDEANICKRLQHANIVQVFDFQQVDGAPAIIMEYVDGADLRAVLSAAEKQKKRVPVDIALYIIAEIAKGLHYAHTKTDDLSNKDLAIIHRDVSPQNILLSYQGEVKITDFGIADSKSKMNETKPGVVKGKYSYMSPEQVKAQPISSKTDVFGLAVVLWETLAMRRLFNGDTEVETIKLVQDCKLPFALSELNPEVDSSLEKLVLKGLAKDPNDRFSSAAEMEDRLLKYLHRRFPDCSSARVGRFIKELLKERRKKMQVNIKKTLTSTGKPIPSDAKRRISSSKQVNITADKQVSSAPRSSNLLKSNSKNFAEINTNAVLQSKPTTNQPITVIRTAEPSSIAAEIKQRMSAKKATNRNHKRISAARAASLNLRSFLIYTAAATSAIVLMMLIFVPSKPNLKIFRLNIRTEPRIVKINIDNSKRKAPYIKTPTSLKLPSGKHRITFSRPGYVSSSIIVTGKNTQTIDSAPITLKRDKRLKRAPTQIMVKGTSALKVSIQKGLFRGTAPTLVDDLVYGRAHEIVAFPKKGRPFGCTFVPKAKSMKKPFLVVLDVSGPKPRCRAKAP